MDMFRGTGSGTFLEFPRPSRCDHSTMVCESLQLCQRRKVSILFPVSPASPCATLVLRYMLPHRSWSSRSCSRDVRIHTPESYGALPVFFKQKTACEISR